MAAVSNIVVLGFGSWSSVEFVPTLGFGVGAAIAAITPTAIDYRTGSTRPQYKAARTSPYYHADNTRPHFVDKAQDKWS
jgi:hypothetical protein